MASSSRAGSVFVYQCIPTASNRGWHIVSKEMGWVGRPNIYPFVYHSPHAVDHKQIKFTFIFLFIIF